ncbi:MULTISPECIES: hypothetical protein [unclassified Novosphingobium]|uniref:hypothetical protein n=1 Tax=unclassified Novosphingobium TaxID=2644732 RepID=UPI00086914D9|nr:MULTISPECIES: hypothetical protein [unclassified Novosphingobium]MBN9146571.1 hypothetical protein [Novosphingobium sp.]MDR6709341.1 hypothetical protein [Novosphingobium sp. 1748]ODU78976.1 MAG: hypothetical protein ABT10_21625 [Novosphingobium sp. SCN 63-17]OJX90907.1 MAG: hypothetical protein BGP00_04755 [Novosphingobium sp. 63-713]
MTGALVQGTAPWFAMVGVAIAEAAERLGIPPDLDLSVLERYVYGERLDNGLHQGLRVDVVGGSLAFRSGVLAGETAQVVIDVTAATARQLNLLLSADPAYAQVFGKAMQDGHLRIHGDLGALGPVFALAHDRIVEQTC